MRGQLEQRGVEVVGLATDGQTAYRKCQEQHPDVVLMDVHMSDADGIEGTRLVMQHCPTCVIVITAFADEETRARAEAVGAMGFLSKPIQVAGVLQEIPNARGRFAEFEAIRAESPDLAEALAARALVEAAKARLVRAGVAEVPTAFAVLVAQAKGAGLSIRAAAERAVGGLAGEGQRDGGLAVD